MGLDIKKVSDFITSQSDETEIYIGADSYRFMLGNECFADYTLVVVVHIDGNHGCKLFGETIREKDYDSKGDKPQLRLMNEVYKVAELYLKLADSLVDKKVEIHLDLNPDPMHVSQVVVQQAIGYIRGVCNVSPRVKPHAFAASCAADRYRGVVSSLCPA